VDGLTFSSNANKKRDAMATVLDCTRDHDCIPLAIEAGVAPHLIALLSSASEVLQRDAASALRSISAYSLSASALFDESTVGPLVFLLSSRTAATREHAVAMLRNMAAADADLGLAIAQQGALPLLLRLLEDNETGMVRNHVAAVIGSVVAGRCELLDLASWQALMRSQDFIVQMFKADRFPESRWAAALLAVMCNCQPRFGQQLSIQGISLDSVGQMLARGKLQWK